MTKDPKEILIDAIFKSDIKKIKSLLKDGSVKDLNYLDDDVSPLSFALGIPNNKKIVNFLIEKGADVDFPDKSGGTPLFNMYIAFGDMVGARYDLDYFLSYTDLLVSHGANINCSDSSKRTILHWILHDAIRYFNPDVGYYFHVNCIDLLIRKGINVELKDKYGDAPLLLAIKCESEKIFDLISTQCSKVSGKEFLCAFECGNMPRMKVLIDKGADINFRDGFGATCLMNSCYPKKFKLLKFLIKEGADINLFNNGGYTTLDCAYDHGLLAMQDGESKKTLDIYEKILKYLEANGGKYKKYNKGILSD
ncbi:hypothetical protein HOG17_03225 [Candidatus Peregrinibacteria bacterium]|jgi:uncharacterized protein|nr:hypothetical protein [Candidatus Peregrinibacteria bacterium]MBT4148219.1 hypothetical protein [Candidatus Peregrinibacteria bacterium]MBT4455983.1 hypothetical protein [Candidatus Peregrinibacteria bacterium]MBT6052933.1 hypothetical protein [Candidatus Scalindua sp.]